MIPYFTVWGEYRLDEKEKHFGNIMCKKSIMPYKNDINEYCIYKEQNGKNGNKYFRVIEEFDIVKAQIKTHSIDEVIECYKKHNQTIPWPAGYGEVHEGTTIKLWYPWDKVNYKTALNPIKFGIIKQYAENAPDGKFIELGVYTGGIIRLFLDMSKETIACDTFKGIKGACNDEYHSDGEYNGGEISDYIKGAEIRKGSLPDTIFDLNEKIALAHFDLDIYYPTRLCIEIIWNRLVPGGVMIFDDYGTWTTIGVKEAVDEFISAVDCKSLYLPTGQMIITK